MQDQGLDIPQGWRNEFLIELVLCDEEQRRLYFEITIYFSYLMAGVRESRMIGLLRSQK